MSVTATGMQKAIRTWHDLLFPDGHDTRILLSRVDETASQHATGTFAFLQMADIP